MPQYMSKSPSGTGYLFRRSVPADARSIIGKREFKFTLGGDYRAASQRCRELAVETDKQIEAARAGVATHPSASSESERVIAQSSPQLTAITSVSPDLVARLRATVAEQVERADREQRYLAREAINPVQKLQEIERVRSWARLAQFGDEAAAHGWRAMLDGTLRRNGYYLADELRDSLHERSLLVEYAAAYGEALDALKTDYSGKPLPARVAAEPLKHAEPHLGSGTMRLSTAITEFLEHLPSAQRAMNEKHGFILPAFLDVVGDMPIADLRQVAGAQVAAWC